MNASKIVWAENAIHQYTHTLHKYKTSILWVVHVSCALFSFIKIRYTRHFFIDKIRACLLMYLVTRVGVFISSYICCRRCRRHRCRCCLRWLIPTTHENYSNAKNKRNSNYTISEGVYYSLNRVSKNVFVIHILPKFKAISWNIDAVSATTLWWIHIYMCIDIPRLFHFIVWRKRKSGWTIIVRMTNTKCR